MNTNQEKHAHALAIAAALGATYQTRDEEAGIGRVTMPDGVTFWLSVAGWSGRDKVHVGTNYPQHYTGGNRHGGRSLTGTAQRDFDRSLHYGDSGFDGINLTTAKTPEQAAKDIARRFLPVYSALYAQAVEYCAKQVEYLDAWEAVNTAANKATRDAPALSVDWVGRDEVTFKARVSAENIEKLAAFMQGLITP